MFTGFTQGEPLIISLLVAAIGGLVSAVVVLYRRNNAIQSEKDAIQIQRLIDAKETRDKLAEPLALQTEQSRKTYELLADFIANDKRRR